MARVFTITPGLENMGGLKTGGQGSIYKGRRIGEIITAVKILPTPISSQSSDDQNYIAFQKEVAKLKNVSAIHNPNVVKILGSGISETGNLPFIEMEYIEGPDLEELLRSPDHSIFSIGDTLKVAEQLSGAIAHCHKLDVRHGDIKSNNVKFNSESCNYVLLDFGLAIMTDDQRRINLANTGSIEFMAPEQNAGQMLFQTDVYSFGVILFQLLTGKVPFPLKGQGESARNEVRLAHMASPVPDVVQLRREALPASWDNEKKKREMQVPLWLLNVVTKCLEKKPEKRFANGIELNNYVVQQLIARPTAETAVRVNQFSVRALEAKDFIANQEQLKKQLSQYQQDLLKKEGELATIKGLLHDKEVRLQLKRDGTIKTIHSTPKSNRVSSGSFAGLLFLTVAIGAFAMYPVFKKTFAANHQIAGKTSKGTKTSSTFDSSEISTTDLPIENNSGGQTEQMTTLPPATNASSDSAATGSQDNKDDAQSNNAQSTIEAAGTEKPAEVKAGNDDQSVKTNGQADQNPGVGETSEKTAEEVSGNSSTEKNDVSKKYVVVSKAYFYNEPSEDSKRNEFISPAEKAVVQGLNERYGFIYVVITNPQGQVFKGWLRKRELKLYSND